MKTILALATLALATSFGSLAYADDISLGVPGYGGTGCPSGSVSTTLKRDGGNKPTADIDWGGATQTTAPGKKYGYGSPYCFSQAWPSLLSLLSLPRSKRQPPTLREFSLVEVLEGEGEAPLHVHHRGLGFWVLEGSDTFVAGDQTIEAGPGSFVFAPRGIPHRYTVKRGLARMLLLSHPAASRNSSELLRNQGFVDFQPEASHVQAQE